MAELRRIVLFSLGSFMMIFAGVYMERALKEAPQDVQLAFVLLFSVGLVCVASSFRPGKERVQRRRGRGMLDAVLMSFTPRDFFRVCDLVAGGVCVFGRTGSGKSSSSGFQIARAIIAAVSLRIGGLILASKPEDKEFWKRLFASVGRSKDLVVFEPGCPYRFNPIDFEMQNGADSREITRLVMTIGETLKRGQGGRGGTNEAFWESQKERTIYNATEIIRKATGKVSAPELAAFITDAAVNPEQLTDEKWRQGRHCQYLARAMEARKTPAEEHDCQQACEFWLGEWPHMDVKVRSSVTADVMGVLHTLNTGEIRMMLSMDTNVSPALMDHGKWILVNTPVHEKGAGGLAVNASFKYSTQHHILRRHAGKKTAPIVIYCDEYQNVCNSFDSVFLAECRSHLGAMIVLTHGLHSFYTSMRGEAGKHEALALLSNFSLKVVHSLGDSETAKFCSDLVGRGIQQRGGYSKQPGGNVWDEVMGTGGMTFNSNEQMVEILEPNVFMHGLRTGGAANGYEADAILIKSGEPFAWGGNWLQCSFSQR